MSGTVGIISSLAVWSWMELAVAGLEMAGISVEVGMGVGHGQHTKSEAGEAENAA